MAVEAEKLYQRKGQKEQGGSGDKDAELGDKDVQHSPVRHMLSILTCNECQMPGDGMLPFKEHALAQETEWRTPDSGIGDEEHQRHQHKCRNPPSPRHCWPLLCSQAGTDSQKIVRRKQHHPWYGQGRRILACRSDPYEHSREEI